MKIEISTPSQSSVFTLNYVNKMWRVERDGYLWFETENKKSAQEAQFILNMDSNATDKLNSLPE